MNTATQPMTIDRIERAVKEHFIAAPVDSWEEAWYFDGLLEVRLLIAGYPSEKKIPRERKVA